MTTQNDRENVKCEICKKNKAGIEYAESFTDYSHGFSKMICNGCYKKILIKKRDTINKTLEELNGTKEDKR